MITVSRGHMEDYNGDLSEEEALQIALSLSAAAESAASTPTPAPAEAGPVAAAPEPKQQPKRARIAESEEPPTRLVEEQTSWGATVEALMADYIKDVKAKRTVDFEHLRVLLAESSAGETAPPTQPAITGRVRLTQVEREALLATRWRMYNRLIDLGDLWARQVAGLERLPHQLDGHHLAGAINLLDIPLRVEDTVLMLRAASGSEAGAATRQAADAKQLFLAQATQLCALARDDSLARPEARGRLPAFDVTQSPAEYFTVVDWPSWCAVFDTVRLRVEKSGIVW